MDNALTEIIVIADRSGSMGVVQDDTIGGFNAFLAEQQKSQDGKCLLTYVQFDTEYEVVHEALPIEKMKPLTHATFVPRGATALLDAVGKTIDDVGTRLANLPEEKRPGNVVVVIMTDGMENSSHAYSKAQVAERVKHQSETYDWSFIFLGQNIDAFAEGGALGFTNANSHMFVGNMQSGGKGQRHAYAVASAAVVGTRAKAFRGVGTSFSAQEKQGYTRGLAGDEDALKNVSSTTDPEA